MRTFNSFSALETQKIGIEIGKSLLPNSVITLFGDLGAGKTTLIKGIAQAAAKCDPLSVNSPTFNYLNIYTGLVTIYHFDLYRLRGVEDFLSMGFDEYFQAGGICCVEWSERIIPLLPKETTHIHLTYKGENTREIRIT